MRNNSVKIEKKNSEWWWRSTQEFIIIKWQEKRSEGENFGTNFWKNTFPKESIKTQKVTNGPNFISQSEPPAPKEIMVDKLLTDKSVMSGVTRAIGAILTPEIAYQERKINSLARLPPIKDPIPNQDKNTLGIEKYKIIPPQVPKFTPGLKSLRNEANDDHPESTDTSRTDRDDTSRTYWYDYIENMKSTKNKIDDDKYKEENSKHQHGNENVIKKTQTRISID